MRATAGLTFFSFGLLLLVAYRSFVNQESPWDLLLLTVLGGVVGTAYQGWHRVLSKHWAVACLLAFSAAAVLGRRWRGSDDRCRSYHGTDGLAQGHQAALHASLASFDFDFIGQNRQRGYLHDRMLGELLLEIGAANKSRAELRRHQLV